jgi:hypothetical protein
MNRNERWTSEPIAKPFPKLKPVEPQRRPNERLEELVALRRVEPRPSLHGRLGEFNALHRLPGCGSLGAIICNRFRGVKPSRGRTS